MTVKHDEGYESLAAPFKGRDGWSVKHIGGGTLEAVNGKYRVSGTKQGGLLVERNGRKIAQEILKPATAINLVDEMLKADAEKAKADAKDSKPSVIIEAKGEPNGDSGKTTTASSSTPKMGGKK